MTKDIPECLECWDGEYLKPGEKCLECGRSGKARPKKLEAGWEKRIYHQLSSADFQEKVVLARRALGIPENGCSRDEAVNRFLSAHIAAAITYGWTLEHFQRIYLSLDKQARTKHLEQVFGEKWAKFVADLTMSKSDRANWVEWLIAGKLVAARLCSLLGEAGEVAIDNVSDMFQYIVSPELRPLHSWKLRPAKRGRDPWQRQFDSFLQVVPLLADESKGRRQSRTLAAAALKLTFDLLEGKITFDECRKSYAAAYPFPVPEEAEPTSTTKMRAYRAIRKLPYQQVLKAIRSLLGC